tara:strand:- start:57 stop:1493 length:1437 start_codon:yes stop_codon:yes gene_type:complete
MAPQVRRTAAELNSLRNRSLNAQEAGVQQGTSPDFEFMTMLQNMGPSLKKNLGDIVSALSSPRQTIEGIGMVAGGGLSKSGIPGLSRFEPYADAMVDMIADRYGSFEALKNTIETDPAGVLMDFSGVLGTAGKITKAGGAAAGMERVAQAGNVMGNTARAIDPINQMSNVAFGGAGALIPASVPEGLYQSGFKPSTTTTPEQNRRMTRTALENGIMPTPAGLSKLERLIGGFGDRVDRLIGQSVDSGKSVDATVLFDELANMEAAIDVGGSIDKIGDLAEVAAVRQKLSQSIYGRDQLDIDANVPARPLSAADLQAIKRDAYNRTDYKKAESRTQDVSNEANQAVGRSARQAIEGISSDEIGGLNQNLGKLLELRGPLTRSTNRIQNRNALSLPQVLLAAGGATAGDAAGATTGLLLGGLLNPTTQARAGIGVERMRQIPRNPIQSLLSTAPLAPTATGLNYAGRNQQGLARRGLLGQ